MSLIDVSLPKKYKDGRVLFEENLDAWRQTTEQAFATLNLNLTQLAKDLFPSNYEFNNDGNQTIGTYLYQYITNVITGATPITGTTSDTWIINSDGNSSTLSTSLLTDVRTHQLPDASGTVALTSDLVSIIGASVPVGSIIPFYDFNAAVTFDTDYWRYCDGSVLAYAASPLDGLTLPDLSNRYLVGFGTEGGGDIDTAAWNAAPIGNASHQVDLQHSHANTLSTNAPTTSSGGSHDHVVAGHTHSIAQHTHGAGSLQFKTMQCDAGTAVHFYAYDSDGTAHQITDGEAGDGGGQRGLDAKPDGTGPYTFYTKDGTGTTASDGPTSTGSNTSTTDSQGAHTHTVSHTHTITNVNSGSTAQDVQPRSIRVRFIMRVL
jgi:hypothetical protein